MFDINFTLDVRRAAERKQPSCEENVDNVQITQPHQLRRSENAAVIIEFSGYFLPALR